MKQQLPLAIQLNNEANLADFCWRDNALLKQQLLTHLTDNTDSILYLWGPSGCGKTHLLQASCLAINTKDSAIYLPLDILQEWGPQVIAGIEDKRLICLDNIDAVAGSVEWEEALFHLYNRIKDNGKTTLIVAGKLPPMSLSVSLADLRSRLSWGMVIQINELNDGDKIKTLQLHASRRGFELPTTVGQFLLSRCARNMHDLHELLNRLDVASLSAQRKITIPFVKATLGI